MRHDQSAYSLRWGLAFGVLTDSETVYYRRAVLQGSEDGFSDYCRPHFFSNHLYSIVSPCFDIPSLSARTSIQFQPRLSAIQFKQLTVFASLPRKLYSNSILLA